MSLFAGLDIASAEDPNYIKPNKYAAHVFKIEVGKTRNGDKTGMKLFYKIDEGQGAPKGATVMEWQHIPTPADPKNMTEDEQRSLGYLKRRLSTLGVPEARMNTVSHEDLIGTPVYVTVKDGDNGYPSVAKVEARQETASAGFSGFDN